MSSLPRSLEAAPTGRRPLPFPLQDQAQNPTQTGTLSAGIAVYWHRLVLALILALSAGLEFIGLNQEGYANTYYAAGVKSMLTSWHNFFFVSFDAGGFVTLDKPPLGLWIQAASAKLFGFSGLSLLAPEALAGVLAVALLYHLVGRVFGRAAGLLAALMLAVTPISAIIDRNNTIDSLLILTLLLAAWVVAVATERGQARWLFLAAVIVGLAFNIKMLQAYLPVPAFALVYLCGARLPWQKRLVHLALAGVILLVVSFSWVAIVDATPAAQRPFISDSGTNSELSLVLGYNGLGRLTQALFPDLKTISILGDPVDLTIEPGMSPGIGNPGLFRLVGSALGGQASWFLLPALAGLLAMLRRARPRWPLERQGQALVQWGLWLAVAGLFFSTARFFHFYYLVMLGPPIAALAGAGLVALWRAYRAPGASWRLSGWQAWLLPVTLGATALLQVQFLNGYPNWSFWLTVLMIGGSLLAALVLVLGLLRLEVQIAPAFTLRVTPVAALAGMALGLCAMLAAPAAWTVASIASGAGAAWLPQAGSGTTFGGGPGGGPRSGQGFGNGGPGHGFGTSQGLGGGPGGTIPGRTTSGTPGAGRPAGGGPGGGQGIAQGGPGGGGSGALTFAGAQTPALDAGLLRYLEQHQGKARYLVATATSSYARLFILDTAQPAMALGGYQGWDRVLTLSGLKQRIANGTVRFFYLQGSGTQSRATQPATGSTGAATPSPSTSLSLSSTNDDLTTWVQSTCSVVPATRYGGAASASDTSGRGAGTSMRLYDCAGKATGT